jgi:Rieske Fe-S protein
VRALGMMIASAPLGWLAVRQLFPWWLGQSPRPVNVSLGPVSKVFASSDYVPTSATGVPTMLIRKGESVEALSMLCTHGQCTVVFEQSRSCFVCPCHGGVFESDGRVRTGPPTKALQRIAVKLEGQVVVLSDQIIGG